MNKKTILMCPGPSEVHPEVLLAMAKPLVSHVDPSFFALLDQLQGQLKTIFQTENTCMLLPGTGTSGMEASLINFLDPGDKVLVGVIGHFGDRIRMIAERIGCNVKVVSAPEGKALNPEDVEISIKGFSPKLFACVHAETSTGVLQPLEDIMNICKKYEVLTLVDTVASLGGVNVPVDDLGIDIVYSGSQKCLGCPPGVAPISFSPRAERILESLAPRNYYLDLRLIRKYWLERAYHHTPPVSLFYACNKGFDLIIEEGLINRFERHRKVGLALQKGLEAMGFKLVAEKNVQNPVVTAVYLPAEIEDIKLRKILLEEFGIEIALGIAQLKGKIARFGTMAESARPQNVLYLLSALENILKRYGLFKEGGTDVASSML
ncbi:Serine--pyruvate transaminase [Thermodesulfobium narugense DSM 14796]|uniref:Serine--pyruvate transaminase n=1 Tax=Thermodesulfobium narugense DSM 14796 TaxID=747365 RepID=M1E6B5_9BACT|nr:alanine--glyoxylate aminotransferase family protein [Thermodesulfobium narugense]AEE13910.1 Serine--pyruvate transaminase [Thermodesulfobium narugense DSM 14796]